MCVRRGKRVRVVTLTLPSPSNARPSQAAEAKKLGNKLPPLGKEEEKKEEKSAAEETEGNGDEGTAKGRSRLRTLRSNRGSMAVLKKEEEKKRLEVRMTSSDRA